MKYLMFILLFLYITSINAYSGDEETLIICGGDEETIIQCPIGDLETENTAIYIEPTKNNLIITKGESFLYKSFKGIIFFLIFLIAIFMIAYILDRRERDYSVNT